METNFRYLVYDIETITDKVLLQKVLYPEMDDNVEGAYQNYLAELAKEGRDFINPAFHQPISIAAVAVNSNFEITKIALLGKGTPSPRALVEHFWETYNHSHPVLVDFHGKGFDLRVLELWAFRLGITIGGSHYDKFGPRYKFSEEHHLDLHEFLTNYGSIRFKGGLNLFSKLLGKPGKLDTHGDMVQGLFDKGEKFLIDDYCLCDTIDTYFVFLRTLVIRGVINLDREKLLVEAAQKKLIEMRDQEGYFKNYLEHFRFWEP